MKNLFAPFIFATLALTGVVFAADQTEKSVALKTSDDMFVAASAGGKVIFVAKDAGEKCTVTLTDLNGGTREDGDEVRLNYTPAPSADGTKGRATFWAEKESEIVRVGSKPAAESTFKLKAKEGRFLLQSASGKFVKKGGANSTLGTTDNEEEAAVFEIVERTGS